MENLNKELEVARKTYDKEVEFVSSCCGAGTYEDYMFCEACGEHCETVPGITFENWLHENFPEFKPSYQDEDDYADAMRAENLLNVSKDNPEALSI